MTFQRISVIAPFETRDAPGTGHMVEGNYEILDNFKLEIFNWAPLKTISKQLRATRHPSGTPLSNRQDVQSVPTDDYFTCPVLNISNRMTSGKRSIS